MQISCIDGGDLLCFLRVLEIGSGVGIHSLRNAFPYLHIPACS